MESRGSQRPMIEVVALHKSFGRDVVLAGVNLTVAEGTATVLLGASGAGKTVLLKHLIGLLRPDRGTVRVDGQEVPSLRPRELERLRRELGIVFQGGALFDSLTVFDNVAFPLRENLRLPEREIAPRVRRALERVELARFESHYPGELSGGMRKRVAFARAIVHEPQILLCDEPTAGLDPITAQEVADALASAKQALHMTSLLITSDLRFAFHLADRLALLSRGRIAAEGTPEELQRSREPEVLAFIHEYLEQVATVPA